MNRFITAAAAACLLTACGGGGESADAAADSAGSASADTAIFATASLADLQGAGGARLQESLGFLAEECGSAAVGFEDGALTTADLNGDGRPDYLMDMTGFTCGGVNQGNGWCGSGGCSFDVFVSTGDDFHLDSYLGMGPEIVRVGSGLGVAAAGRDGPWTVAWNGEQMASVEDRADASAQPAAAAGGDEAAVRAVVASIYDAYADGFDSGASIPDNVETAEFRAVIEAAIDPEMGGLGFDYYCACQDYGDVSYTIRDVSVRGASATARLDFVSFGRSQPVELRLRKVGGRWQVDDVIDIHGSVREQLGE